MEDTKYRRKHSTFVNYSVIISIAKNELEAGAKFENFSKLRNFQRDGVERKLKLIGRMSCKLLYLSPSSPDGSSTVANATEETIATLFPSLSRAGEGREREVALAAAGGP